MSQVVLSFLKQKSRRVNEMLMAIELSIRGIIKKSISLGILMFLCFALTGITQAAFVHPGCLSKQADLDRMAVKVAVEEEPWKSAWDGLLNNSGWYLSFVASPQEQVYAQSISGHIATYQYLMWDCHVAYQCALRYSISGETGYGDKAVEIMNAWASTHIGYGDSNSNAQLRAGLYGFVFACAGELMRDYEGWAAEDFEAFQKYMIDLYYNINMGFLTWHNGTCDTHYWANWELASMTSALATSVLSDGLDDPNYPNAQDMFDDVIDYYYNGVGNGNINNLIYHIHPNGLAQWQEFGRDQGHASMGVPQLGAFCEIAWNQGLDLYSELSNAFLSTCEHMAKHNLFYEVPYDVHVQCDYWIGSKIGVGQGFLRQGYDLVYNHYVNRMGMSAPYSQEAAEKLRPDTGPPYRLSSNGAYDQVGFTTLTHSLDPIADTNHVPSFLLPHVKGSVVTLSWRGTPYAESYNVKRSTAEGGPYVTIATVGRKNTYYVDSGLVPDTTYYYVVSANNPAGESADSDSEAATTDTQLHGTVIGTEGSVNGWGLAKETVFDGSLRNFFNAPFSNDIGWAGLDLGEGVAAVITQVKYCPISTDITSSAQWYLGSVNMVGGKFQGSNTADFSNGVVDLFTISEQPTEGVLTAQTITNGEAFRYVRYYNPLVGRCSVAEVQFLGNVSGLSVPAAPYGVRASTVNGSRINLSWDAVADATSYNVKRATTSGGPYIVLENVKGTSFTDTTAPSDTTLYYVVTALNSAGESADLNEVVATTQPADPVLQVHCRFDGNVTDSSDYGYHASTNGGPTYTDGIFGQAITLDGGDDYVWLPSGAADSDDITIATWVYWNGGNMWQRIFDFGNNTSQYLFLSPRSGSNTLRFAIKNGGGEQIVETSQLATGQWVHVAVTLESNTAKLYVSGTLKDTNTGVTINPTDFSPSVNYIGKSQWPDPLFSGKIDDFRVYNYALSASEVDILATDTTPLAVPTGLNATADDGSVLLDWTDSTESNLSGYKIYRSTSIGGPYNLLASGLMTSDYIDETSIGGVTYYYVVTAVDVVTRESGYSNEASVTALDSTAPLASTNLTATAADSLVYLDWANNTDPDLVGYKVYRSTTSGSGYALIASDIAESNYVDDTVANGTTYYYVVTAVDTSDSESGYSNEAMATGQIDITAPAAPTDLTMIARVERVDLDWAYSTESDLASYTVYRSTTSGGPYSVLISDLTASEYTDNTVIGDTTYYYVVTAVDLSLNESVNSSEVSATPQAATLSVPWNNQDIGGVGLAGSSTYDSGAFTIRGAGSDIHGPDSFQFAYQSMTGDGEIVARLDSIQVGGSDNEKVGLMMRESLIDTAKHVMVLLDTSSDSTRLATKTSTGATSSWQEGTSGTLAKWFKLIRIGNTFTGYVSDNGWMWTKVASSSCSMSSTIYVGMAVCSRSTDALNTTVFDNVSVGSPDTAPPAAPTGLSATAGVSSVSLDWDDNSESDLVGYAVCRSSSSGGPYSVVVSGLKSSDYIDETAIGGTTYYYVVMVEDTLGIESGYSNEVSVTPQAAILPDPWNYQDIGSVGLLGETTYDTGVFTLNGAGSNIHGPDSFQFAYQSMTGDGEIVARLVSSQIGGSDNDKVGLMMRESLTDTSKHVAVLLDTSSDNARLATKTSTGGGSSWQDGSSITLPKWFKLTRVSDTFTGYVSDDGESWTEVASSTCSMASSIYIGMAACSRDTDALNITTFDNVSPDTIPPVVPTGLSAMVADATVILDWQDNPEPDVMHYNVYRSTTSGSGYELNATGISTSDYADSGVTNGTTYYYVVAAVDTSSNESSYSTEVSAEPFGATNYGFETPTTSGYIYNPTGADWTFSGSSGVSTNGSGFTSGNNDAPEGTQIAFLQIDGTITQTIDGFTAGKRYQIVFSASQRQNKSGGQLGQTFNVTINGSVIGSFEPSQGSSSYADYTASFTASDSSHSLAFVGTNLNGGDNTVFLDSVRIAPNMPPVFTNEPIVNLDGVELSSYSGQSLADFASDSDGSGTLTFSKDSGPSWLAVEPDGTLSGFPSNANIGSNTFTVRVTDPGNLSDTAQMTINVTNVYSGTQGLEDFAGLAAQWLTTGCSDTPACNGADLTGDNNVDVDDLSALAYNWLADESLQLHLQLDETSGLIAYDSSIYTRHGDLVNGPVWSGGALDFDGSDDYVRIAGYKGITSAVGRTCAFWIKTTSTSVDILGWGRLFDANQQYVSGQKYQIVFYNEEVGALVQGGNAFCAAPEVNDDQWHHVAVVLDDANDDGILNINETQFYIDGSACALSRTAPLEVNTTAYNDVHVGMYPEGDTYWLDGFLDDLRIYDRALSETEIQAIENP